MTVKAKTPAIKHYASTSLKALRALSHPRTSDTLTTMHYPGDVDADQPHAGYRMPDEDDVLWPDSGYGDPDGGTDGGFALTGGHYGAAGVR